MAAYLFENKWSHRNSVLVVLCLLYFICGTVAESGHLTRLLRSDGDYVNANKVLPHFTIECFADICHTALGQYCNFRQEERRCSYCTHDLCGREDTPGVCRVTYCAKLNHGGMQEQVSSEAAERPLQSVSEHHPLDRETLTNGSQSRICKCNPTNSSSIQPWVTQDTTNVMFMGVPGYFISGIVLTVVAICILCYVTRCQFIIVHLQDICLCSRAVYNRLIAANDDTGGPSAKDNIVKQTNRDAGSVRYKPSEEPNIDLEFPGHDTADQELHITCYGCAEETLPSAPLLKNHISESSIGRKGLSKQVLHGGSCNSLFPEAGYGENKDVDQSGGNKELGRPESPTIPKTLDTVVLMSNIDSSYPPSSTSDLNTLSTIDLNIVNDRSK